MGNLAINLQTAHDYALYYGMSYILTQRVETMASITNLINKITADDIMRISKEVFKNEKLNMVLIGPYDEKQQKDIVKNLKI